MVEKKIAYARKWVNAVRLARDRAFQPSFISFKIPIPGRLYTVTYPFILNFLRKTIVSN